MQFALIFLMAAVKVAVPLGLDAYLPVPASNPLTAEKITLGRKLFFDPILSGSQVRSCSS